MTKLLTVPRCITAAEVLFSVYLKAVNDCLSAGSIASGDSAAYISSVCPLLNSSRPVKPGEEVSVAATPHVLTA